MQMINFWNGNKSVARQCYEVELLQACLSVTEKDFGAGNLHVDNTDYPLAEDEGAVFEQGTDILVTVAGNVKFSSKPKIIIEKPLAKGLLGFRLLLVRADSLDFFKQIKIAKQLQEISIGIPKTWSDAELFRHNDYAVVEDGTFEELLPRLKSKAFEYAALGANEIEEFVDARVAAQDGVFIEPTLMLYYPFPLVFYIHRAKPDLARRVADGLQIIMANGEHERLFVKHHGDVVARLQLHKRTVFHLHNAAMPQSMAAFTSPLLHRETARD